MPFEHVSDCFQLSFVPFSASVVLLLHQYSNVICWCLIYNKDYYCDGTRNPSEHAGCQQRELRLFVVQICKCFPEVPIKPELKRALKSVPYEGRLGAYIKSKLPSIVDMLTLIEAEEPFFLDDSPEGSDESMILDRSIMFVDLPKLDFLEGLHDEDLCDACEGSRDESFNIFRQIRQEHSSKMQF
jgi:hypothetical protein